MKKIILIFALWLILRDAALALNEPIFLYVSTTGSDTNSCASASAPCLTIQGAVLKVPSIQRGVISVDAGTYVGEVNIVGYIHPNIIIAGPEDARERCIDPAQVVIDAPGEFAIWAQDHATVILRCLTIGQARVGVSARQFSIVDIGNLVFGNVNTALLAADFSIINCGIRPLFATVSGFYFARASHGQLNIGCQINVSGGLNFTAFFSGDSKSVIDTSGATFVVSGIIGGKKWILDNSQIGPSCSVPGTGVTESNYAVAPRCGF